ncbi:MAG: TatD family hydrolase [Bacteroidaceae bacterium]|nr:TatD family hydrolase [Bacteroidaceae bacterium]
MLYIDFHTHHIPAGRDVVAVVDGRDTWGIHPWRAAEAFVVPDLSTVFAIGECGLDGVRGPSMDVQERVFLEQVRLGEQTGKPLVIHCVKALDRLLSLHKALKPQQPWMFHGFRGKPQQLRSLLDSGFYVSFGFLHNEESLRICPADRLLLETDDDSEHPIAELYNNVARERGIDVSTLCDEMAENYRAFFRREPLERGEKVKN